MIFRESRNDNAIQPFQKKIHKLYYVILIYKFTTFANLF